MSSVHRHRLMWAVSQGLGGYSKRACSLGRLWGTDSRSWRSERADRLRSRNPTYPSRMEREELAELHYIAPMGNVRSVLERGILSNQAARGIPHASIAMPEIQERRASVRVPNGLHLHDYANLYLTARNPMLYKRRTEHPKLCVLRVDVSVLDLDGVVISDGNASSDYVRFEAAPEGLAIVDAALTFAPSWDSLNAVEYYRRKSAKCAEVLVPHQVDPALISGAYVSCEESRVNLAELAPGLHSRLKPALFFL